MKESEQIELELAAKEFARKEFCTWMARIYFFSALNGMVREPYFGLLPKETK